MTDFRELCVELVESDQFGDTNKMVSRKVFLVTLQYRGYVLADDDFDAEDIGRSIAEDERPVIEVEQVRSNVLRWPGYACVYHAEQLDRDITVSECFPND